MRGFKNFKGSDARCPSIHFLFYGEDVKLLFFARFLGFQMIRHFHAPRARYPRKKQKAKNNQHSSSFNKKA